MDFGPGGPLNNVGAIGDAVPIRNGAVGENAGQPPGAQLPDLDMLQRIFQAQAGFDMQLANEMPKFRNLQAAGNDGIVAKLRDLRATIQDMNNTIKGMNNTLNGMNNAINDTRGQVDATYNEVRGLRIDMYARTSAK